MNAEVVRIHSSAANKGENGEENTYGPTDVIVYLSNNETYIASFYSRSHIQGVLTDGWESNAAKSGVYFWGKNMVIAEDCSLKIIEKVVRHLMREGDFLEVFEKIR